jgi:steroid delta-isomerase-like uncharacterized protein
VVGVERDTIPATPAPTALRTAFAPAALAANLAPPAATAFNRSTFGFIDSGKPHTVAAALALGREHVIPAMFRAFLGRMDRCYREQVTELVVMAAADGSRAAAEFFILGSYLQADDGLPPANGQSYRLRVGAFFEIRGGRIARVTNYYNLEDWLAQVRAPS